MSKQKNKKTIILIDEPELHLHPKIQQKFVEFLFEISKDSQIIITTHSPLLVKQMACNELVKFFILNRDKSYSNEIDKKLSYVSSNEINYLAFGLATEEYQNELYESLLIKYGENGSSTKLKKFDNDFFIKEKGEKADWPWKEHANEVSLNTYVRNKIHHRAEMGKVDERDLERSIEQMRKYF